MASVRAHGPTPKARSTIRASPTMPPWRANIEITRDATRRLGRVGLESPAFVIEGDLAVAGNAVEETVEGARQARFQLADCGIGFSRSRSGKDGHRNDRNRDCAGPRRQFAQVCDHSQGSYWRVLPRCGWCWRRWVFGAPRDGVDSTIIGSGASSWWSSRHHSPHGGEPVSVVARAESHLLAVEVDEAVVGDGVLVGAAPEVSDDVGGAGERRFSILPIISSSRCATRTIRYSDKRPLCFARKPTKVSSVHKDGPTSNLPNVGDAGQHATSLSFVACQRRPRFRKTDKFPNPVRLLRWGAAMMVDVCSAWNASGASGPP